MFIQSGQCLMVGLEFMNDMLYDWFVCLVCLLVYWIDKLNLHKLTLICFALYMLSFGIRPFGYSLHCNDHPFGCEQRIPWKLLWKKLWRTLCRPRNPWRQCPSVMQDRLVLSIDVFVSLCFVKAFSIGNLLMLAVRSMNCIQDRSVYFVNVVYI